MFHVVGMRRDGEPILLVKQSTRQGAEFLKRLMLHASHFSQLRIERGPDSGGRHYGVQQKAPVCLTSGSTIGRIGR